MIFWPCCCDANCRCVGCATLEISGIDSGAYLCDDVVSEAYNRTVVMWRQNNSTATPFDLLADPTDCDSDYTNYPGTKCKGESYACCQANYSDTPIEPIPIGGGYEVPGTEAGTDCFPAIVCASGTSVCTTKLTKPTQPTHHYYVDADGYVWLAIVSYEYDVDIEGLQPHIVIIYKSSAAINCATINSAEGAGVSFTMSQVCQGLAAESSQCAVETTPLIDVSGATITLKIYSNVSYCCDAVPFDQCNDDEGACGADVPCNACPDGVASNRYLLEIEGAGDNALACECSLINGSYVLDPAGVGLLCCYEVCTNVDMPCDSGFIISDVKSIKITLCFGLITDPSDPTQVFGVSGVVYGYTDVGCTSTSEILLTFEEGFWNIVGGVPQPPYPGAPSDCVNINRYELTETNFGCDATNLRIYLTAI